MEGVRIFIQTWSVGPLPFFFSAEEVVLARTHRAIEKPPLGTAQSVRKSLSGRSLRLRHPLLCEESRPTNKLQGKPLQPSSCLLKPSRAYTFGFWGTVGVDPIAPQEIIFGSALNRDDAHFTGRWMMKGSVRSASSVPHFQVPRCGKTNMMLISTSCCSSCEFSFT